MRPPWNHNINYHRLVLAAAPSHCRRALDVGCGLGLLAHELTEVSSEVIGIDSNAQAIASARAAHYDHSAITFIEGDALAHPFAPESFDLISAVAVLHHLPLARALARFRELLAPDGVLTIIGLYRADTPADFAMSAAAVPATRVLSLMRGMTDVGAPVSGVTQTLGDIRYACAAELPRALVRRLLLFRYSLVWRK